MVGSRLFSRLLTEVARARAKLVCVGDAKQLLPIEAGWIFKRMASVHGEARLSQVRRQEVPWQLEAGKSLGRGESLKALIEYQAHGRLTVSKTARSAIRELVAQWEKDGGIKDPGSKLILASTNAEVREINRQCQAKALLAGALDPEKKVFHEGVFLYRGERVLFTKRMTRQKIENSWVGTVEGIDEEKGKITVRLDKDGRTVDLNLKSLPKDSLRQGWASTTHKAQGRTVDLCYVLMGGPLSDRHIGYVQGTRHRKDCRLYLSQGDAGPELRVAARALSRARDKSLAVEILERQRQHSQQRSRGMSLGF
jgi:ATP-dependent exoDNAse (exonuclease V) alpha subunit